MHGFRQTQTAMAARSIARGGPVLRYETPHLGPPWSHPFELPVYQAVVGAASAALHTPLEQTGRVVSLLSFYAALAVGFAFLRNLRVSALHAALFPALALLSPLYIFWSRTFLIESTAVLLGALFLLFCARLARDDRRADYALAGLAGILGATVKPTTFFGFAIAALFVLAPRSFPFLRTQEAARRTARNAIVVFGLPFVCTLLWTHWADAVKAENPLASQLIATNVRTWYLGTLAQRFSAETWATLVLDIVPDAVGTAAVALASLLLLPFVSRPRARQVGVCWLCFLAPFVVFTNLHLVHAYYPYANGLFLVAAVALAAVGLLERGGRLATAAAATLLCVAAAYEVARYRSVYATVQGMFDPIQIAEQGRRIAERTQPQEILVVFGVRGSPELAYYADRRSLVVPPSVEAVPPDPAFQKALRSLRGAQVALVLCGAARAQVRTIVPAVFPELGWKGAVAKPASDPLDCVLVRPRG